MEVQSSDQPPQFSAEFTHALFVGFAVAEVEAEAEEPTRRDAVEKEIHASAAAAVSSRKSPRIMPCSALAHGGTPAVEKICSGRPSRKCERRSSALVFALLCSASWSVRSE
jgi:hypothetical protein